MDDHFITAGEFALMVGVFVGPFLLAGAITQFALLRRAGMRVGPVFGIVGAAAVLTLLFTWGLVYIVPLTDFGKFGGVLIVPGLLAAIAVTSAVVVLAKRVRPAA
jgi:hypothetical protein